MLAQLTPHHQVDQFTSAVALDRLVTHQPAIAQYHNALGHALQLLQPMGDIDDGDAAPPQALDLGEQQLHLARGEHGRGFVEDQHMAVTDQVAGYFHHLLMADSQLPHRCIRIDGVQADLGHGGHGPLAQAFVADPAEAAGQVVEKQVLGHGQRGQQVEFLHDHAHAQPLGLAATARRVGLAAIGHASGAGHFQAADEF
ncbi:hypothetical protein D3C79_453390 [compost metagenome]